MTTPIPDDSSVRHTRSGDDVGAETPPGGRPAVPTGERVRGPRLLAWSVVFGAILLGLALYLLYAGRLPPLLD